MIVDPFAANAEALELTDALDIPHECPGATSIDTEVPKEPNSA
jgi:hypothetical protein